MEAREEGQLLDRDVRREEVQAHLRSVPMQVADSVAFEGEAVAPMQLNVLLGDA
jgi:hypothetical protein